MTTTATDQTTATPGELEQARILSEISPELREVVGRHSTLWNYSKTETVEKITNLIQQAKGEAVAAERSKHTEIYRWLCGYYDFPERLKGMGAYWWRSHLMEKLRQIGIKELVKQTKGVDEDEV